MNNYLEQLKESNLVYSIYQTDLSIFGLEDTPSYTVIVKEEFDTKDYPSEFIFYTNEVWSSLIVNNAIISIICYFLPKQYIIKEFVKIPIAFQVLDIRKQVFNQYKLTMEESNVKEYI